MSRSAKGDENKKKRREEKVKVCVQEDVQESRFDHVIFPNKSSLSFLGATLKATQNLKN